MTFRSQCILCSYGVFFACTVVLAGGCTRPSTDPIPIGHIAPESGGGVLGQHARQGIALAVDDLKKGGNLIQGRGVSVRHLDDRGSPEVALADAVRLITLNRVHVILADTDAAATAEVGAAAKPYGVPVVALSNISLQAGDDAPNSLGVTMAYQGRILARFVKDGLQPKIDRALVVFDDTAPRNRELVDAFRQEFKSSQVQIDPMPYKDASAADRIRGEIRKAGPGAVLVVGSATDFVQTLRGDTGGSSTISWLYAGEESQLAAMQDVPTAARDMYFATAYTAEAGGDRNKEFVDKYRAGHNGQEPDVFAALAYENATWLFESMRNKPAILPAQIREALETTERFDGLTGTILLNKGHATQRPMYILQLAGRQPKVVKVVSGE